MMDVINAFTVDVEDWYQAVTSLNKRRNEWDKFESRVEKNTYRMLSLLDEYNIQATFFILGCVAEQFPDLIRSIDRAGHEIGIHGYWHQMVHKLNEKDFSKEIDLAMDRIQPLVNQKIIGHRAPYFSINAKSLWALDVLERKGFRYDSSFFATKNVLYGYPGSPRNPHYPGGRQIIEIPISTARWAGITWPLAGGFYMRLFPYFITKRGIKQLNMQGYSAVLYVHPWELDIEHRYNQVTTRERIVQYTGRAGLETKLRRLFNNTKFGPIREIIDSVKLN